MTPVKEIELQQLGHLRNVSQKVSQHLQRKINDYLGTITPLLAPRKVLGQYMQSAFNDKVPGDDKNFAALEELYKQVGRDTFGLSAKLGTPLPNIPNKPEVYPWEYLYRLEGEQPQTIRMSSPVRWVLGYSSAYDLARLLDDRLKGEQARPEALKEFLVYSLTLWMLVDKSPGLQALLRDLRFEVSCEKSGESGALPYVVLNAAVPSFRPQDDVIRTVIQLSGIPVFEELIDVEALADVTDPFKDEILGIAKG